MTDKDVIQAIEALDAKRSQAILNQDYKALEPFIGEDLCYVHSSSVQENKKQYLDKLGSGHYHYRALDVLQREFRVMGEVVLVNGDLRISVDHEPVSASVGEKSNRLANGILVFCANSSVIFLLT